MDLLTAVQTGGSVAQIALVVYLFRLDRRVLRLEIKTGNDQPVRE